MELKIVKKTPQFRIQIRIQQHRNYNSSSPEVHLSHYNFKVKVNVNVMEVDTNGGEDAVVTDWPGRWASIYDVRTEGGEGLAQKKM